MPKSLNHITLMMTHSESYGLLQIRSALWIECRTGMKRRGPSALSLAKEILRRESIKPSSSKIDVWKQFNSYCLSIGLPETRLQP
jgi:hypothetical protein